MFGLRQKIALAVFAFLASHATASALPTVSLPTVSTSGELKAEAAAKKAGVAHLIHPLSKGEVFFHWTTPETPKQMREGGIKIHRRGQSDNGDRSGPGFYVSDRIQGWSNLNPTYKPVALVHDGALRVIDRTWFQKMKAWPSLKEAKRLGIDGYEERDELVLYNSAHMKLVSDDQGRPLIAHALKTFPGGEWNAGGIARIAHEYLPPEEAADVVKKAFVKGLLIHEAPLGAWSTNPSQRALDHMLLVGLDPQTAGNVEDLVTALKAASKSKLLPMKERVRRNKLLKILAKIPKLKGGFEERLPPYRKALPKVYAAIDKLMPGSAVAQLSTKLARIKR